MILEALLGPIIGIGGALATAYSNYKMKELDLKDKQLDRQHALAMLDAQTKQMLAETEANIKIAQTIVAGQTDLAETQAFLESQRSGATPALERGIIQSMLDKGGAMGVIGAFLTMCLGFADVLKALMRPALTSYSAVLATWASWQTWLLLQSAGVDHADIMTALDMWKNITDFVLLMTGTLFGWWFGDRRMAKFVSERLDKAK